jgi:hypothetical protein
MSANIPIGWYSMNRALKVVDHPPVSMEQALFVMDEYFRKLQPKYEWGEDGIAASMFGFQKSTHEFIEITINAPDNILLKHEVTTPQKIWFLTFNRVSSTEKTLSSADETKQWVALFFTRDTADFRASLDTLQKTQK